MDAIESAITEIVDRRIAELGLTNGHAEPEMLEPKEVYSDPRYKISKELLYDLIKGSPENGFPCTRLGPRVTLIDKHRLNRWLAAGGLGVKT